MRAELLLTTVVGLGALSTLPNGMAGAIGPFSAHGRAGRGDRASMIGMTARRAKIIRFPTPPPRGLSPAKLVEACRCRDQAEALVVRGLLESESIGVVLQSRLAQSVYPFSVGHQGEVVLLVAAGDLPRARAVLQRRA